MKHTGSVRAPPCSVMGLPVDPGRACILVTEDNVLVRNLVSLALNRDGHFVLVASDSAEALNLCRTYSAKIHLLISNITLLHNSLLDHVHQERPDTRVILMAEATRAKLAWLRREDAVAFLKNPVLPKDLSETILRALTDRDFPTEPLEV